MKSKSIRLGLLAGVIIGGTALGATTVSAQTESSDARSRIKGVFSEIKSGVLDISKEEVKELKKSGQSFEDIVLAQGFSSVEDFQSAIEVELRSELESQGYSDEEIEDKIASYQQRVEIRSDYKEAAANVLGVTVEDLSGSSKQELLEAAGFEDKDAFKDAVVEELTAIYEEEGLSEEEIAERLSFKKSRSGNR